MNKGKINYIEEVVEIRPNLPYIEGKAYKRKADGVIFHGSVFLGKRYFENGVRLKTPVEETPEDFELVEIETEKIIE